MASSSSPCRRPRANTAELLGQEIIPDITVPENPKPDANAEAYTVTRVKSALAYADATLRHPNRKLALIGIAALKIYKETCKKFLELEMDDEFLMDDARGAKEELRLEYIANLQSFEHDLNRRGCLTCLRLIDKDDMRAKLEQELVKLRRLGFYARYGDYLVSACKRLHSEADSRKVEAWGTLTGGYEYWIEIVKQLNSEASDWEKVMAGEYSADLKISTHNALHAASHYTGSNFKENLLFIRQYVERNGFFQAPLHEYIKAGEPSLLGERLAFDLNDILFTIPDDEQTAQNLVASLINTMVDLWYDRYDKKPENYKMWSLNSEWIAMYTKFKTTEEAESVKKQVTEAWVARIERRSSVVLAARNEMAGWDREVAANRRRKRRWDFIINSAFGLRGSSEIYIESYGEFAPLYEGL